MESRWSSRSCRSIELQRSRTVKNKRHEQRPVPLRHNHDVAPGGGGLTSANHHRRITRHNHSRSTSRRKHSGPSVVSSSHLLIANASDLCCEYCPSHCRHRSPLHLCCVKSHASYPSCRRIRKQLQLRSPPAPATWLPSTSSRASPASA